MSKEHGALTALPEPQKKPLSGLLSFLALVFSMVSLAGTGFLYWEKLQPAPVVSRLVREEAAPATPAEATRIALVENLEKQLAEQKAQGEAQQAALVQLRDDMAALASNNADKGSSQNAESLDAITGVLQQRLADIEAKTNDGLKKIASRQESAITLIASLARVENIARNMRDGLTIKEPAKVLGEKLAGLNAAYAPVEHIKGYADRPQSSDTALREGLRALTPDFIAREKMDAAENPLDKVAAQLQKLVVVRPRHGGAPEGQGVSAKLYALDIAIAEGDFAQAITLADELAAKAPKDFPAWKERLTHRADAEKAVAELRDILFGALLPPPAKTE